MLYFLLGVQYNYQIRRTAKCGGNKIDCPNCTNRHEALILFGKETADIKIDTKFSTNILKRDLGRIRIMLPSNGGNIHQHGHPEKKAVYADREMNDGRIWRPTPDR